MHSLYVEVGQLDFTNATINSKIAINMPQFMFLPE